MINTYELRRGNLIKYTGKPYPTYPLVDGIVEVEEVLRYGVNLSQGDSVLYESENLEGIPLTPEWLERCGFKYETIPPVVDDEGDIIEGYSHWNNGRFCFHFSDGKVEGREHIRYIHLLQNWYYFNTGEELTIK